MFKGQITYDNLTLHYPPSVAQFLIEEIEKVAGAPIAANQDPASAMMRDDDYADQEEAVA